ncbi:protein myomixer-like [Silurus meridionalis]|uniref:protein myomixer-like n=1 Tax=Silurus meridionalis TaxID=175797 RepID=UPI001EEA2B48|nr:protein myomixer-like [Silurus meridionalis]
MPAVFLLIRSALLRLFGSRLAGAAARALRRSFSAAAAHLTAALRLVWERLSSQESKEAIVGCVLCILNMHKKVDN